MSLESYTILMYIQLLAFMLVSFALIGYYVSYHHRQKLEEVEADIDNSPTVFEKTEIYEEQLEPKVSDLNYLDIIYQESHHQDKRQINSVRLHGKHKN